MPVRLAMDWFGGEAMPRAEVAAAASGLEKKKNAAGLSRLVLYFVQWGEGSIVRQTAESS
jgi:hypothetical protein